MQPKWIFLFGNVTFIIIFNLIGFGQTTGWLGVSARYTEGPGFESLSGHNFLPSVFGTQLRKYITCGDVNCLKVI